MDNNNHEPIYCRECRSQHSFELCPERDIITESGRSFMLGYRCKICNKVVIMTNPDYMVETVLHHQNRGLYA